MILWVVICGRDKKHQAQVKELEIRERSLDTKFKQAEQDASKRLEELKLEYYTNVKAAQDFTDVL